jgi:group I intron endonuclease
MKNNIKFNSIVCYYNTEINKKSIIKENKKLSGIYLWYNNSTYEFYIGSSKDLGRRLRNYFSIAYLSRGLLRSNSLISSAILKYDYSKFDLYILEYCDTNILSEREQFFIDSLNPSYNIHRKVRPR